MVSKGGNLDGIESEHQIVSVMKWDQSKLAAKHYVKTVKGLLRCSYGELEVHMARYTFRRRATVISHYVQV